MDYKLKTVDYFNKHAKSTHLTGRLFEIKMRITKAHIKRSDVVLDAGCGNGEIAAPLSKHCRRIFGVDISPGMITELKARVKRERIQNCTLLVGDMERLPLKDHEVDAVISFATLYYVKDLRRALKELCRVTRPGGVMVLELFNSRSFEASYSKKNFSVPQFHHTLEEYTRMFEQAQLDVVEIHRTQLLPNALVPRFMDSLLGKRPGKRTIDEIVSSLPLMQRYAMKFIFVLKVRGEASRAQINASRRPAKRKPATPAGPTD